MNQSLTPVLGWTPYCGPAPAAGDWRWNLDPVLLLIMAGATALILMRTRGRSRGVGLAAMAVLGVSFVSPLCALSSALFSARTVHHVLLVAVAAPLLADRPLVDGRPAAYVCSGFACQARKPQFMNLTDSSMRWLKLVRPASTMTSRREWRSPSTPMNGAAIAAGIHRSNATRPTAVAPTWSYANTASATNPIKRQLDSRAITCGP